MDFLEIRKKAKEQAAARAAAKAAEAAAEAPAPTQAPAAPVPTDADLLEGALAARLEGPSPPQDERFVTWRPGDGAAPRIVAPPAPDVPEPRREDFTVVSSVGGVPPLVPAPLPPLRPAERASGDPLAEFFYREDEEAPEVPVLGTPGEPSPTVPPDLAAREEYLTFLLGKEEYAIAIERVREVMRSPPITEVPHAPPHVLGVVTVRGEVVAVFDPRRRLGLPGAPPPAGQGRVVIVDAGEGPCGLLVDAVASVVRLRPGSIEPRPQGIGGASAECLAGIGRHGERLFTVLDLGACLRRPGGGSRRADPEDRNDGP